MEKKNLYNKKYVVFAIMLILFLAVSSVLFITADRIDFGAFKGNSFSEIEKTNSFISNSGQLSSFSDGSIYVFTDKTKIDSFRSNRGADRFGDLSEIVVDSSYDLGTQQNPYVITNLNEWETFVKLMEQDTNHGRDKFFVLGADLDFQGQVFRPVRYFFGTFYGMGYSLKNIVCDSWQYWNNSTFVDMGTTVRGFGVFCQTTDATIADLIVEDYEFSQMPQVPLDSARGSGVGPIIGFSCTTDYVLNCHTDGKIILGTQLNARCVSASGLIGMRNTNGVATVATVYRCSVKLDVEATVTSVIMIGGVIGELYLSTTVNIYDTVVDLKYDASSAAARYIHASSAVGWGERNSLCNVDGFFAMIDVTSSKPDFSGSLTGIVTAATAKNVYVDSLIGDSTQKLPYPLIGGSIYVNSGISNANIVKPTGVNYAAMYGNDCLANYPGGAEPSTQESKFQLIDKAVSDIDTNLHPQIWNKDRLKDLKTKGIDIDTSPVRNYLYSHITFKNLLNGDVEEGVGIADGIYSYQDSLPSPSGSYVKPNHVFVGWTTDKTGESEPFNTLPEKITGLNTLYAVWTLPSSYVDSYLDSALSVKDGIDEIEYDSVTSIVLQAKVTHTPPSSNGMVNPSVKYHIKKDGKDLETSSSGELNLKVVADSGSYTYLYRITDGSEPLWFYDGDVGKNQQVTINKGHTATAKNFKIDDSTKPYFGRNLSEMVFSLDALNAGGAKIEIDSMRFESLVGKIAKGDNSQNVVIVPKDQDNYVSSIVIDASLPQNDLKFTAVALVMNFHMEQISRTLTSEVEYGIDYAAPEIIYLFNQEYMKALESDDKIYDNVREMAPYFEGKPITPDNSGIALYDEMFEKLTTEETIEVTFKEAEYKIIFDYNDDGATPNKVETRKYGEPLTRPADPTFGSKLFGGWYFDAEETDEDGNIVTVNREWKFYSDGDTPRDRVKGNTTLQAKWFEADSIDSISITVNNTLEARQKIKEGDLTVKAVYLGGDEQHPIKFPSVTLPWSAYENSISYATGDGLLHVTDGGYEISITYTFNGNTVNATKKLDVTPIKVSTSGLTFKDKTVVLTDPEKNEKIDPIQGVLPSQIKSVKYVYLDVNGDEIDEADVKGLGVFTVRAQFEMISSDYSADALTAVLSIINSSALIKPTFKGGVTYDGTEKRIEDYLDNFLSDYMELYGDGVVGKNAGKYFVNIRLKNSLGITWDDGTTSDIMRLEWTIDKATLVLNWDEWEFVSDGVSGYSPNVSGIASGLGKDDVIDFDNDFTYKIYDDYGNEVTQATDIGAYKVVATYNGALSGNYVLDNVTKEWTFVVVPKSGMTVLTITWDSNQFLYDGNVHYPTPTVTDNSGNSYTGSQITDILSFTEGYNTHSALGTYRIIATVKDGDTYFIRSGGVFVFKITDENGNAPSEEETKNPSGNIPDENDGDKLDLGAIGEFFKSYWKELVSGICLILTIIFLAKTASYESKRKKANKRIEKYSTMYATATGLFGLASNVWLVIMCVCIGLAVASFVIMIIAKNRFSKAEEELEDARTDYERNGRNNMRGYDDGREEEYRRRDEEYRKRDEDLKALLMNMMSGNNQAMPQGVYMGGQGIGMDDMRMMINDAVTALLPNVQQALPQQASANDDTIQKLIDQNEKLVQQLAQKHSDPNDEIVKKLIEKEEKNDATIKKLMEQNEKLMQKLAQKPVEKVIEKEVVATNANDETIKTLVEGQKAIMQKLAEQSTQPQIIEKVVEKPVEKIVEKEVRVEVPVEKVVEKPIEKIVEKVVEKPVVHVISTEAAGGAEKSKQVKTAPKKAPTPRLTLAEAYAQLTKEQKKFFDGLREYAMKKDSKCKEKLATYFTTIGPSTTNPLIKLTIKKGITVALFKMEDEYLKDIRRNAGSDGTKIKVKETEMPIGDIQAFETAKDMVDLRVDQIERYEDFLKEQRALRK